MLKNILSVVGGLFLAACLVVAGAFVGYKSSDEIDSEIYVGQAHFVPANTTSTTTSTTTQSGLTATDWERVCKGLEAYVYDSGQLPSHNPCGSDVFFVVDAPWNGADTNSGELFVTSSYETVLESQKVWPNGSLWVTSTMDYVAKNMGDWCAGNAPKIVETTTVWQSCGGDFVYVVVDPWTQGGKTNPGTKYTFQTIELALEWMEEMGYDSGSIWVELPGYSK